MKTGDRVWVHFSRNNIYKFQDSPSIEAHINYTPQDVGDYLGFYAINSKDIFTVNPNCSEFIGMELIEEAETKLPF